MTFRGRIVCVKSGSIALRAEKCRIKKKSICHVHVPSKLLLFRYIYDSGISWLHSIWCPEKDNIRPRILKELDGPQSQW